MRFKQWTRYQRHFIFSSERVVRKVFTLSPPAPPLKDGPLFVCFQGEAAGRREPAAGAQRGLGPLHRGHCGAAAAAAAILHVALVGPESADVEGEVNIHHSMTQAVHT